MLIEICDSVDIWKNIFFSLLVKTAARILFEAEQVHVSDNTYL